MTVRSWVRRRRALGALAVTALAVSGCSAQSGAAAVVDGEAIPISDVQQATTELAAAARQPITSSGVLALLVAAPTVERVAADHGVAVSDQQARQFLTDLTAPREEGDAATQEGTTPGPAGPGTFSGPSLAVARLNLLQQGLQQLPDAREVQQELFAQLGELDVEVNPRYGQLDFAQGGITPVEHPWLVATPEPEAAAP